ncbi:MAG: undecaprenyldiphospho-muramoylpentapeptide beta-N-acetylglucosaminyltransferase [Spirochaetaceae bacterium]|nr:MAG: undecaprenyldiphospho-muramoylpentapeptide beta-N-acetylglucosaminyltransferase [Spirochaetaceae bacterium]
MRECIVVTGGGTGGHVYPVLAVLDELSSSRIVWIGSGAQLERRILEGRQLRYYGIPTGKLRRYISLRNVIDIFKIVLGFLVSVVILLREKPKLVFSKGGYVSVPPVAAARLLGIPSLTHESDLRPGLATRINARFSDRVLVSFPTSAAFFDDHLRQKLIHTGNPIRKELLNGDPQAGRALFGCPANLPLLLVLGGSQGAASINRLVLQALDRLRESCFVVHQLGSQHYEGRERQSHYYPAPYFHEELPDILAAADLVLCRAGANTLWELAALGKPSLLVPLSREASRGDQIENAKFFAEAGAAAVLQQEGLTPDALREVVLHLLGNADKLERMARRASQLGRPDAAKRIAEVITTTIGGGHRNRG